MSGLFGGGKTPKVEKPPEPKVVRMPTTEDPNAEKAASRYRQAAAQRKGRRASILTDTLRNLTGSSGEKLGS